MQVPGGEGVILGYVAGDNRDSNLTYRVFLIAVDRKSCLGRGSGSRWRRCSHRSKLHWRRADVSQQGSPRAGCPLRNRARICWVPVRGRGNCTRRRIGLPSPAAVGHRILWSRRNRVGSNWTLFAARLNDSLSKVRSPFMVGCVRDYLACAASSKCGTRIAAHMRPFIAR